MSSPNRKFHVDGTLPFGFELWVFGSNLRGYHKKGAALVAAQQFGAAYGVAEGLMGRSYAIPTKNSALRPLSLQEVAINVAKFVDFTKANTGDEFWVTAIGCGYARFKYYQIAPLFKDARNCNFPFAWRSWLEEADALSDGFAWPCPWPESLNDKTNLL